MIRTIRILILAALAATATIALVSISSAYVSAMMKENGFMLSSQQPMSQRNHMNPSTNPSNHMNATPHTYENMPTACKEPHDPQNMAEHMMMGSH